MSKLEDLTDDVDDPALQVSLAKEVARLKDTARFGLVFEEHLPGCYAADSVAPAGRIRSGGGSTITCVGRSN
jgi:hypothetical protein